MRKVMSIYNNSLYEKIFHSLLQPSRKHIHPSLFYATPGSNFPSSFLILFFTDHIEAYANILVWGAARAVDRRAENLMSASSCKKQKFYKYRAQKDIFLFRLIFFCSVKIALQRKAHAELLP